MFSVTYFTVTTPPTPPSTCLASLIVERQPHGGAPATFNTTYSSKLVQVARLHCQFTVLQVLRKCHSQFLSPHR